jgi:hypothetical protein
MEITMIVSTFLRWPVRRAGILHVLLSAFLITITTGFRPADAAGLNTGSPGASWKDGTGPVPAESPGTDALHLLRSAISGIPPGDQLTAFRKARKFAETGDSRSERRFLRSLSEPSTNLFIMEEYGQTWSFAWNDNVRWLYTRDVTGRLLEEARAYHNGSVWEDDRKWIYQYDASGQDTTETGLRWTGSAWVNEWKWSYTYDSTGNLTGELVQLWSGGNWANWQRWTYTYNAGGDLLEELREDFPGGLQTNNRRYTSTYSGTLLMMYAGDLWNGSAWDPDFKIDYTHDGHGNFLTETRQDWNTGVWENSWRYTYEYDASDNDTSWFFEVWVSGWMPSDLDIRHYNGSNQPIFWEHSYYDAGWVPDWRGIFSWYGDGRWLQDVWYYWTGSVWDYDEKYFPVWGKPAGGQSYPVQDKWNMVSVPLTLSDYTATAVFPNAVSSAFAFTTQYENRTTLENGVGYWVKFDGAQNVSMNGSPRPVDTFAVAAGWTMVGSVSGPVSVSNIVSDPPGMVTSNFFAFDNGYTSATTIEPGKAYWVKIAQGGSLILDANGNVPAAARIRIVDTGEMPPPPR